MKAQLNRERLEKIASWREKFGTGHNVMLPAEEAEAMALMLLAAMDSEPVGYYRLADDGVSYYLSSTAYQLDGCIPLYAAPPAPVAVPECFHRLLHHAYGMTMGHDWNNGTMAGHHREKLCRAVEDCRAAMLKAEPVTVKCPKCGGTGLADSGGAQPWGEPISIPCDCTITAAPEQE